MSKISGRHNSMLEDRSSYLRHYPSTPQLDTFSTISSKRVPSCSTANIHRSFKNQNHASSNANLINNSYMPKTSFSTFVQKSKPVAPPTLPSHYTSNNNNNFRSHYQDEPNPYKVSRIHEYQIKVNDPFSPKVPPSNRNRISKTYSFYTQSSNDHDDDDDDDETENVRQSLGNLSMVGGGRSRSSAMYDDDSMTTYSDTTKVSRSATLKSTRSNVVGGDEIRRSHHMSGSASVQSASSTGTGEIDIDGGFMLPEPDYDNRDASINECDGSRGDTPNGITLPDSSCTGSEGYSSVSAATSTSDPDPYAVPTTSSPDEGAIVEATDSGIETPTRITMQDRDRVRKSFCGRNTYIFVADCLANLYCMHKSNFVSRPNSSMSSHNNQNASSFSGGAEGEWVLKYTGVPVLLLDLGGAKSREKRRIQIVLGELGSGLALWKDVIDNLSSYKVMDGSQSFHTMHLSTDHTKIIGLSFDDEECAETFHKEVDKLTSNFENISLSGSKKKKSKKTKETSKQPKMKYVRPQKSEISQPCAFEHISSLTSSDRRRFPSLQSFLGRGGRGGESGNGNDIVSPTGNDQISVKSSSSHEDFLLMSPLALADNHGSDLHF